MKVSEWIEEHKDEVSKVKEYNTFGENIRLADGSYDMDKIMDMSILMCSHDFNGDISITLC